MKKIICSMLFVLIVSCVPVTAQEAEIKISLDEQFFEALLEAVFNNLDEPKVQLSLSKYEFRNLNRAKNSPGGYGSESSTDFVTAAFEGRGEELFGESEVSGSRSTACDETVRLKREMDGVRTSVKFRQGKIYSPIAFEGNYNPPLIGCIGFSGWAETQIDLVFDKATNALVANAKVLNVNLSGTNGVGGSLVSRLLQRAIDRKMNPFKIIDLNRLSFTVPVQDSGKLRMEAIGIRHEVLDRKLDVYLKYEFKKAPLN